MPGALDRTPDWIASADLDPLWEELAAENGTAVVVAKHWAG
jgi:hypothetical protein